MSAWNVIANRVTHALVWTVLSLCVCGCDPSAVMAVAGPSLDAGPAIVAAVPTVKESLTVEVAATCKESLQVRSPDCDCESCECKDCCCGKGSETQEAGVKPVVKAGLYFHAGWCSHCQKTDTSVADLIADGMAVEVVDFDARPDLARYYGVTALPAFVKFGTPQSMRYYGERPASEIAAIYGFTPPAANHFAAISKMVPVARVKVGNTSAGGVVIGPGKVLTASHVVHAGWPHAVEIDGKTYPATVVKDDAESDLACVSYDGPTVPSIAVAQSEPAEGTAATAYGFPAGGAQQKHATTLSRRWGNFAAVGLYHSRSPFVPGDSGGPVVNAAGELVGIVTGTDTKIGVGLVVDQPSIVAFLGAR